MLWCFRNGLLVHINGFLSLIRFGDDLDELLLGGLQMRSDVNVKMEYAVYIQILVNQENKRMVVRKCEENDTSM